MSNKVIVNKFGGGILTPNLIPVIKKRLVEQTTKGAKSIAVVSAMPGVTDELLSCLTLISKGDINGIDEFITRLKEKHEKIISSIIDKTEFQTKANTDVSNYISNLRTDLIKQSKKSNKYDSAFEDLIVSYGEKLSAIIFQNYLVSTGITVHLILAENIPIITDENFKNANIEYGISEKNINNEVIKYDGVIVIPGFTGLTKNGKITTLGRGGTDTTACFVGASLRADMIILWKDVGGVLSADPKIVKEAVTIPFISYMEAEESGKIIHEKAIQYVKMFKTPIEIASISNPKLKTKIGVSKVDKNGGKIVSLKKNLSLIVINDETIKVNDLLLTVSQIFTKFKVDIILISNTRYSIQILADNSNGQLDKVFNELQGKVNQVIMTPTTMVYLVGKFVAKDVSNFNDLLVKLNTDLLISAFYYENCNRMEAVIKTDDIDKVIKAIYKKFIK